MKIIYSGGWNKNDPASVRASFLYTFYEPIIKAVANNKKIAFVTLAKPDGYYDPLILPLYKSKVDIIDSSSKNIDWAVYDGIFLLGGSSVLLLRGLNDLNFGLNKLKDNVVLLGDSAGAYVLSAYFFQSPSGELRGIQIEFCKGLHPASKIITVAHTNNSVYCNDILLSKVAAFAKVNNLTMLSLHENEQKLLDNEKFVNVDIDSLFN